MQLQTRLYWLRIGAMKSMDPAKIVSSAINRVANKALLGSPLAVTTPKILRKSITPSLAIARSNRGAPTKKLPIQEIRVKSSVDARRFESLRYLLKSARQLRWLP